MYVIGKPAEFGSNNLPLRGQCQPHTKGWRLRHFSRGQETLLYEDNYYTCREIQKACAGLSLEEARAKGESVAKSIAVDMQETQQIGQGGRSAQGYSPMTDETPVDLPTVKAKRRSHQTTEILTRDEMPDVTGAQNAADAEGE